jgi:hypothetical protein
MVTAPRPIFLCELPQQSRSIARGFFVPVATRAGMLERGDLRHSLTEDEYGDLLFLELEELEAAVEEIEASGTAKR